MLANIFFNRRFIGALAFFIFCFVGGTLYMWHVEREGAAKLAETEAHVKAFNAAQKAARAETSESGVLRADGVVSPVESAKTKTASLSAEDLKDSGSDVEISEEEFYRSFGLDPPPAGYVYSMNQDGSIELIKRGVPTVELHSRQGFATWYLSEEDWELYQALKGVTHPNVIKTRKIPPEVVEMARERLEALKANGQGPIFTATTSTVWDRGDTETSVGRRSSRAYLEKVVEARLELGITPELFRRRNRYHMDYDLIDQLIAEFKEELQ